MVDEEVGDEVAVLEEGLCLEKGKGWREVDGHSDWIINEFQYDVKISE